MTAKTKTQIRLFGAVMCFGLLFTAAAAQAGGPILIEQGARAMGQSSAVVARPDDASAVFYNPAGLAWQEGIGIMVGNTLYFPSFVHEYEGTETDVIPKTFPTPNLYVTYRILDSLSVGIGTFALFGLGTEWPEDWIGREVATFSEMQSYTINPCVVYRPLEWLAIGAGFDLSFVSLEMRQMLYSGLEYWNAHLGGNTIGYGGNAGILVRPLDWLSIGAHYRSAMPLSATGRVDFDVHPTFQGDLPDQGLSTDITLPHVIMAGVGFEPIEGLSFEVDTEFVLWSSFDELRFEFDNGTEQALDFSWQDVMIIRVGAEYIIPRIDLAVRAGYIWDTNAVPDRTLNPGLPDADRHDVSVGLGYSLYGVTLDAAYMAVMLVERTVSPEENIYLPGTYDGLVQILSTHLSYRF